MGSIIDATILHHVSIVLLLLWLLNSFDCCHPVAYFLSLIYLYLVHEGYVLKLRKILQVEEKRESNQRRVLSDSESVRWLNHAIEKMWPICIEEIISQKILLPIIPWFLKKYKPWTADNLLALVFEQTLVEPNMLVVDVEKFASPQPENWFTVDAKEPIAYAIVEVLEAAQMKPSDLNGLADPYVKGQLGPYRFRTKTQKKTLAPKWNEEFKVPICTWESQNMLIIEVRDKDRIFDDTMGDCSVSINDLRDGQRHDLWLPLQNIKMGRLHLAITVSEGNGKAAEPSYDGEVPDSDYKRIPSADDSSHKSSFSPRLSEKSPKVADKFEPIDIKGQSETGIWIHRPGSEVAQVWEPRKGKSKPRESYRLNGQACGEGGDSVESLRSTNDSSSTDESMDSGKAHSTNPVRKGLKKIGSVFRRSPRTQDKSAPLVEPEPSPHDNIRASNAKGVGVRLIIDNTIVSPSSKPTKDKDSLEESELESPHQGHMKDMAKSILKHAEKSARTLKFALSRKASRKSKADPTDKDAILEPDSSDDESLSASAGTPIAETGLVISGSSLSSPAKVSDNNNSSKSKEGTQTGTPMAESGLVISGSSLSSPAKVSDNNNNSSKSKEGTQTGTPMAESGLVISGSSLSSPAKVSDNNNNSSKSKEGTQTGTPMAESGLVISGSSLSSPAKVSDNNNNSSKSKEGTQTGTPMAESGLVISGSSLSSPAKVSDNNNNSSKSKEGTQTGTPMAESGLVISGSSLSSPAKVSDNNNNSSKSKEGTQTGTPMAESGLVISGSSLSSPAKVSDNNNNSSKSKEGTQTGTPMAESGLVISGSSLSSPAKVSDNNNNSSKSKEGTQTGTPMAESGLVISGSSLSSPAKVSDNNNNSSKSKEGTQTGTPMAESGLVISGSSLSSPAKVSDNNNNSSKSKEGTQTGTPMAESGLVISGSSLSSPAKVSDNNNNSSKSKEGTQTGTPMAESGLVISGSSLSYLT
ncbi:hypothetical protein CDL12_10697 [Handroanthus impetiginosus]|uniref:C2 domain-containing protein n=1 Tax=Handroanthus impetiginosus TaxID=429701 RepID=A0A2G9HGI6_9LAMI|nr:hypothetical protein CDL12_10697 [Handroanthus impetiginosus]